MGGVCERPGCSRSAGAAVAADPRRSIVWIGDLESSGETVNKLCAIHADTLAVPVGWERRDVREAPRLFAVPSTPADPPPPPRRRRRTANPSLGGGPAARPAAAAAGAVPSDAPVPTRAKAPARPTAPPAPTAPASLLDPVESGPTPPANLGELHRGDATLSAGTAALLRAGGDTPLLARAFRTARAAG